MDYGYFAIAYLVSSIAAVAAYRVLAETHTNIEILVCWVLGPLALVFLLISDLPDYLRRANND